MNRMEARSHLRRAMAGRKNAAPGHVPLLRAVAAVLLLPRLGLASPGGMTVQSGTASTSQVGAHLQVTASHNAVLHWQSFNIGAGERASFLQPSANSVVWNHIQGSTPSAILGQLDANGVVVLINAAGFHFGPDSSVSAAGLVISTAPPTPIEGPGGLAWQFNGPPPEASIINYGRLEVGPGGSAFLIAHQIENHGSIEAPGGSIGLASGREVLLSERPDGRGLSATVRIPEGAVDNRGRLIADAGTLSLHAKVVNQGGLLQANSVRERNGVIELVASDHLTLAESSTVRAQGDGSTDIHLQSLGNLSLRAGASWDLASTSDRPGPKSHLHLEAGGNISLANGSSIQASDNWSVSLEAGRDFATPNSVVAASGNISLSGNASIQTGSGDIALLAGNNITVGSGAIRTVGGGSIDATAVAGSINTGTRASGYRFLPTGYVVDPELGGISTAAGGDVSLSAGLDVISHLPLPGGTQSDAGTGAFGAEPGRVTVQAGRDVSGHYVVRNGEGRIQAGRDAGTPARLLALSLIDGSWSVDAERDVLLQEIRNPNGVFNNLGSSSSPNRHRFDYSESAAASLRGGNSVQLRGTTLPRFPDVFSQGMPPIYPGTLDINAGAGGVILANDVILFPSPLGNLSITTTDGGSLMGTKPGDLTQFVVSDSARRQYRAFGDFGIADHGASLLHADDPEPVRLAIAGDMQGILLGTPKRTEISVGGDMVNSRFDGQNLSVSDVTRIHVAGDIRNRNEFTSIPVEAPPDFSPIDLGLIYPPPSGNLAGIESRFAYHATAGVLTFQGRMTGEQLQFLLAAPVRQFDASGSPILLANGEPATRATPLLPPEVARRLYDESQDVPLNPDTGYRIGGGGALHITARNIDLGATAGVVSHGPRANPALATRFTHGASVSIALSGDLDMFSTKVASLNGGDIRIVAEGRIRAGSSDFTASDAAARGIFTVDPSDITVIARGDIDVNGSRIAAYDGGNVTVRSLEGDVNAGSGGSGAAIAEKIVVDPVTRRILTYAPTIPGSGILATTFPPPLDPSFPASTHPVGNILVETPRGDILASAGGVVQLPLNGSGATAGTVTLRAGTRDESGQVTHPGSIDASGSGVIGSTVRLEATGDIKGLVFARESIDLAAQQGVNVTALAQGNVNVSSGGNISGTIIGVGSVTAAGGGSVDAALLSQNVSASGNVSSAQVGFSQGNAANATSQAVQSEDPIDSNATGTTAEAEDPEQKRKQASRVLVRTVGRVTVILPDR